MQVTRIGCMSIVLRLALLFGDVLRLSFALPPPKVGILEKIIGEQTNSFDMSPAKSNYNSCPGCKDIKKNSKEYKLYLEYIKADILSKLGMKQRPKKSRQTTQMPAPVSEGKLPRVEKPEASENKLNNQIIIIGEKASKDLCPEQDCFLFRFKKKAFLKAGSISSLQIWIYKLLQSQDNVENKLKVSVSRIVKNGTPVLRNNKDKQPLISFMHEGDTGWLGMVSAKAKDWISMLKPRSGDFDLFLSLHCDDCIVGRRGDKRPFIVITVKNDDEAKDRVRREATKGDCHPGKRECCRESLFVNFTEIGWNDWIVSPMGYEAYYCKGTCYGLSMPIYGYVAIISQVKYNKKICCSPKSFRSLTILYRKDNTIYKRDLPDMSVEKCGCS
eukprot:gene8183-9060_t